MYIKCTLVYYGSIIFWNFFFVLRHLSSDPGSVLTGKTANAPSYASPVAAATISSIYTPDTYGTAVTAVSGFRAITDSAAKRVATVSAAAAAANTSTAI